MRALVDDSHGVRDLANYLLADALSTKVSFCTLALLLYPHLTCASPVYLNVQSCVLTTSLDRMGFTFQLAGKGYSSAKQEDVERASQVHMSHSALQAPLLAYNHFVEAVFVLNECRPGLQAAAPEEDPIALTQLMAGPVAAGACRLIGSDEATRAKRDTIYR